MAIPAVPLEQLRLWVREQESLLVAHTQDPEALLECAATVRSCGLIPDILPVAKGCDGLKTAAQIRTWTPIPDEVILVQDESLSIRGRGFGDIELFSNVLAVNVGYRPLVAADRVGDIQTWPMDTLRFPEMTLEGAVTHLIAEVWNVPPEKLMDLLGGDEKKVAVGKADGKIVRKTARVLRRPTPSPAGTLKGR